MTGNDFNHMQRLKGRRWHSGRVVATQRLNLQDKVETGTQPNLVCKPGVGIAALEENPGLA